MDIDKKPKKPYSYYLKWRNNWLKDDWENNNESSTVNERVKDAWLNIEDSEKILMLVIYEQDKEQYNRELYEWLERHNEQ